MGKRKQVRGSSEHGWRLLHICVIVLVILGPFIGAHGQAQPSLETDRAALERFKAAVDPAGDLLPWVSGTNPCTWVGVQCFGNRVATLRLPGNKLTGFIPASTIGDLDQLRVLSLHHNGLTGPFPVDLSRCTILQGIFLGYNSFSGSLPDFIGVWPRLTHFNVAFNNFSGEIPASISELRMLIELDLQGNALSGKLPAVSAANLVRFSVANNKLEGSVPPALQNFTSDSFSGNDGLCGPPTATPCPLTAPVPSPDAGAPTPADEPWSGDGPQGIAEASSKKKNRLKLSVASIASITAGSFVALVFIVFVVCRSRRDDGDFDKSHAGKDATHFNGEGASPEQGPTEFNESYAITISSEPASRGKLVFIDQGKREEFGLDELLQASAEVLGKGSIGTSYKADLHGDSVVIVKRLKDVAADQKEFETRVEKLGRLRHRHLMPLRAYYFSRDEKLLVTDFMPAGSLHSLMHDTKLSGRYPLDWVSREKIALGTARALAYLDKPCVKMPHGDIKSSNILLNRDYEPFVADHGLVHLLNPGSVGPSRFVGYRAPEVTDIRKITMQSDVYSFGVMMLELVTGRAPERAICKNDAGLDLPKWVRSFGRDRWASDVIDPELKRAENFVEEEALQVLQLALACADAIPESRPKMEEVVLLLEDITQLGHVNESSVCPLAAAAAAATSSGSPKGTGSRSATPTHTHPSSGVFVVEN